MPTKCSVKNCKSYYGAGETMFKIPIPCPQSWLQAIARDYGENNIRKIIHLSFYVYSLLMMFGPPPLPCLSMGRIILN